MNMDQLDWTKMQNSIPAIIQDERSLQVLMLGYMNRDALHQTLATKQLTFYSRSQQRLWTKGESSGNTLTLIDIVMDCDNDTLLIKVKAEGPTCHNNTTSCFSEQTQSDWGTLCELEQCIEQRQTDLPENSYTAELLQSGMDRMAQKVGEEGLEVALAAVSNTTEKVSEEAADLIFHLLVLLHAQGLTLSAVIEKLSQRR